MRRTDMRRTVVFLLCLLVLAASIGLQGQGQAPREPMTIGEVRAELKALRDLNDERFRAMRELLEERKTQVAIAFDSSEKAVRKAEEAQQRVNQTQNEFRGSLKDQASNLATKESVDQSVARINERLNTLEKAAASGAGRGEGTGAATETFRFYAPIIVGLFLAALGFYWRRREAKGSAP